jgi:hypothetical protein
MQDVLAEDLDAVFEGGLVVRVLLVALRDDDVVGLLVDLVLVDVAELAQAGGGLPRWRACP